MNQCDIGLIGLAVMGENLVLNMESRGFTRRRLQPHHAVTEKFAEARGKGKNFVGAKTLGGIRRQRSSGRAARRSW